MAPPGLASAVSTFLQREDSSFKLMVGRKEIASLATMETALCTWIASFPVFNLSFPSRDPRAVCTILYREVLKIDGGPHHNAKALTLLSRL